MKIPDYEIIHEITRSDWYSLYRARRKPDKKAALLKTPLRNPPGLSDLELLEHEAKLTRDLSLLGILSVSEVRRDDRASWTGLTLPGLNSTRADGRSLRPRMKRPSATSTSGSLCSPANTGTLATTSRSRFTWRGREP